MQKNSFLAAFDVKTGKELWRTAATDVPTWGSPTIHQVGRPDADPRERLAAHRRVRLQDRRRRSGSSTAAATSRCRRRSSATGSSTSPTRTGRLSPVYAIRETAKGDISLKRARRPNAHVAWSVPRDGAYLITPVLYQGLLYVCKSNGAFIAFDAKTGERVYQQRLGTGTIAFTASIVAADGKVYFTNEDGDVYVVKAGRTFELLATTRSATSRWPRRPSPKA